MNGFLRDARFDKFVGATVKYVGVSESGDALELTFEDGSVLCAMANRDKLSVKTRLMYDNFFTLSSKVAEEEK